MDGAVVGCDREEVKLEFDFSTSSVLSRILDGICSVAGGDDSINLPVLLTFVRCPSLLLHAAPSSRSSKAATTYTSGPRLSLRRHQYMHHLGHIREAADNEDLLLHIVPI